MDDSENRFPVVVIGAGLAGLTAALHLAEGGIPPLVLEADALWAGGRLSGGDAESFEYQGRTWSFKPEHGVHALWGNYANMRAMIARFTTTRLNASYGEEWINRWGREVRMIEAGNAIRSKWIPAPFHYLQLLLHPRIWQTIQPWDFLSLPGFLVSILLTLGVDPLKEKIAWDGLTMADFFKWWTPNLRVTFEGLGANLLAAPKSQISLAAYIAALRFYTILRRDAWRLDYLPADAQTSLIQPLITAIEAREGYLMRGMTAIRLERVDNLWRILVEDSRRQGLGTILAEQVILALNPTAAERLLVDSPSTADKAKTLIFPQGVANATVRLWFSAAPREGTIGGMFTGDFAPDNFFWLQRLYDDYRAWHDETGGSALELHYYEDSLLEQADRNLIVLSVSEVLRAFPNLKGTFIHGTVRRNSKVHSQFRVPTGDSLHVQTAWENLYACGDWVGYDSPAMWMERSTITGMAAANSVLEASGKIPFPIILPPEPELLARWLGQFIYAGRRILSPVLVGLFRLLKGLRRS